MDYFLKNSNNSAKLVVIIIFRSCPEYFKTYLNIIRDRINSLGKKAIKQTRVMPPVIKLDNSINGTLKSEVREYGNNNA